MKKLEELVKLAERIKDETLRKKVIDLLKNPKLSNREFVYSPEDPEKIPSALSGHHARKGGNIEHTISVTKLAIKMAEHFEEAYGAKINYDYLIAGAILHDWMKVFIYRKIPGGWGFSGCTVDHAVLAACELYKRDFPEEVIHIVEAHGGDLGQSAARPQTVEALIVFYADVLDSAFDSLTKGENLKVILFPEEEV